MGELYECEVNLADARTNSMSAEAAVKGADHFAPAMREFAQKAFASGLVLKPDVPGRVLAWFALHAPQGISGRYLPWEEAERIVRGA